MENDNRIAEIEARIAENERALQLHRGEGIEYDRNDPSAILGEIVAALDYSLEESGKMKLTPRVIKAVEAAKELLS